MKYDNQFNESDKVQIKTALGKLFKGEVEEIVFEGSEPIGFWWHDKETGLDEFIAFEEVETVDVVQLTQLEKALYISLGKQKYEGLEQLADKYDTNPQEIVLAFVNDLISSSSGSDDHVTYAARRWFFANLVDGKFVRE